MFQALVRKVSRRAYDRASIVRNWRAERCRAMVRLLELPPRARIVDLGGSELIWQLFAHDFHVTLVNLPGFNATVSDPSRFTLLEADACHLGEVFPDRAFDAVFSNSTIEHVGDESRQELFAAEARRLAPSYWVQTPSTRCPIEIHTGVPFYWQWPAGAREALLRRWHATFPEWTEMIRGTRVLSRRRMADLFPDGRVYVERRFGLEKSYSFYRPFPLGS
jgi:hypothetical protein